MDKGIRLETNRKFLELLPTRENSRVGNTAFRKNVMFYAMEQFDITLASAATHYNHSFLEARKAAATDPALATLLEGLGRPEDKKGGRKPKIVAELTAQEVTNEVTEVPEQTEFTVKKKFDGTVVAEGLTFEAAKTLIDKAAAAKKAKLYWV